MPRTIKVAAIQMDANPAPINDRLARAEKLVAQAVQAGAQLVVLPELFNLGYAYTDKNFERAEPLEGATSTWMKATAVRFDVHLAGTFLHLERGEIYNTMLLLSPMGQIWRYEKNYPWAWERGYFRGRRGITIANTELGDLGLLICWDIGHRKLWKQYAGKADMIVIASCPPDPTNASYEFSSNEKLDLNDLGSTMSSMNEIGKQYFGEMVNQQARWLGVPAVNSGASGRIQTHIPKAGTLLRIFAFFAPRIVRFLPKAEQLQLSCEMIPSCKVVDASGHVLAERAPHENEGFVIADVTIADSKSPPAGRQPKPPLKPMVSQMATFQADVLVPAMMRSVYKNGLNKIKK